MAHILNRAKLTSKSSNVNAVAKFYTTLDEAYISLTANNCNDYLYNDYNNAGIFGAKSYSHSTYETYIGYISGNSIYKLASFSNQQISLNAATKIEGHILPASNAVYNIGSHANQWNKLYVTNGINDITSNEIEYLKGLTSSVQEQLNNKETAISLGSTQYALVNDIYGKVTVSSTPASNLLYISGTSSNIQAQLNTKQNVITGAADSITTSNITPNIVLISNSQGKVNSSSISSNELIYLSGVYSNIQLQIDSKEESIILGSSQYVLINNSNGKVITSGITINQLSYLQSVNYDIQTQIDSKQNTIIGALSSVTCNNLSTLKVLISDSSGKIAASSTSANQLNYLSDVTYPIQQQITVTSNNLVNMMANIDSNMSNYLQVLTASINADKIQKGTSNTFIVNNTYNSNLTINGTLTTSNLYVVGNVCSISTPSYTSKNLEIITSASDGPAIYVKQNSSQDIAHFYDDNSNGMYITNSGKIGIGKTPTETLDVNGSIQVKGHILPSADVTYDLGSSNKRWRDLYLSGNTIYLGSIKLSSDPVTKGLSITNNQNEYVSMQVASLKIQTPGSNTYSELKIVDNSLSLSSYNSDGGKVDDTDVLSITQNMSNNVSNLNIRIISLNSNMSNYISQTSILATSLDSNISNYISNTNPQLVKFDSNMSNYLSKVATSITPNNTNVSNYISKVNAQIILLDSNISNSILTVNSRFTSLNSNMSNYISTINIRGRILDSNMSNFLSQITPLLNKFDSNMSNYISTIKVTTLDSNMSNYISSIANAQLDSNVSNYASNINVRITLLNSNMSNYISTTNARAITLDSNVSNYVSNRISSVSAGGGISVSSQWTTSGNNIYYTTGNVGIGTSTISSSNELDINSGDLNITNGSIEKTSFVGTTSNFVPSIWYQFNENPITSNVVIDYSTAQATKYHMITSNITSVEYPPVSLAAATGTSTNASVTLSGQTYGNGTYIMTASSSYDTVTYLVKNAFNKQSPSGEEFWTSAMTTNNQYSTANGLYAGITYTIYNGINVYYGEWIQIQLPNTILLTRYTLVAQVNTGVAGIANRGPKIFALLGSTDGTTWTLIDSRSAITSWGNTGTVKTFFTTNIASYYSYYRICINANQSGQYAEITAISEWRLYGYNLIISKTTGSSTNSYLYQNAYLWNGSSSITTDNMFLVYNGNTTNIQTLLNSFHNNKGFSIHFVFKTSSTTNTSHILYIGYNTPGNLIRAYITNTILYFQVGAATVSSTAISANVYYVADLVWSYVTGGNMTLTIYLNNVSVGTNSATSYTGNSLLNVSTTGLLYYIGRYSGDATNDATPITLQDFRIFAYALSTDAIAALQSGSIIYIDSAVQMGVIEYYQLERWTDSINYYTNDTSRFITYNSGNVGIGTNYPLAELHVGSGTYGPATQNLRYLNYATGETTGSISFPDTAAIFDSSIWVKSFIGSSSDERIKKNITDINDDSALQMINAIQPKTYNYIDPERGTNTVYGFLAQQVKEVLPEAVTEKTAIVPNIFSKASCSSDTITLGSNLMDLIANDMSVTSKIEIIDCNGNRGIYQIIDIDPQNNSIKVDRMIQGEEVFIYGTEVNNFNVLDKSYIFTLNTCATQTLYNKTLDLKTRLASLAARLSKLEG